MDELNDNFKSENAPPTSEARHRLETEHAAQALALVYTLLDWEEAKPSKSQSHLPQDEQESMGKPLINANIELRWVLEGLHPADVAYVLEALPLEERLHVWGLVNPEYDGEILLEVSDSVRETLIADMSRQELVAATESLDTDEIAELADDLPREVVEEVAENLPLEERAQLRAVMSYPDDSVGSAMDFEMLTVRADMTLELVLQQLRAMDELPKQIDQIFVVDEAGVLQGSLSLERILINQPNVLVADVMRDDVLQLNPLDDMDDAAQAFERYDLMSAPVVDTQNRLMGRLTIDEVVDAIREQGESEVLAQVGLKEEQDIFSSVPNAVRNRAPWLLVNLFTAGTASYVASRFDGTVQQIVVLAFLMSIVAGIGGNSGNQTMTLIIRALALGQITGANLSDLVRKELAVTSLIGIGGGLIAAIFAYTISGSLSLGLVMMASMFINMLVGAGMGMLVPMVREKMGKDPAVGSSVLLTFATDTMGFLIFLGLATVFLL
ncbi:magnesium transporter [Hydromonas duriensis]|uniref:Magnesium transporter MgtE n=1 Tax=Hydromonas duriensis TaxID=1527608 RepID=A0A4R6YC08_9BURK|nr:magnesium transporter [Hydromonas duriensis]TDR33192.1 Mg2+ transporter MgtE [Hydromonas duriensis]